MAAFRYHLPFVGKLFYSAGLVPPATPALECDVGGRVSVTHDNDGTWLRSFEGDFIVSKWSTLNGLPTEQFGQIYFGQARI